MNRFARTRSSALSAFCALSAALTLLAPGCTGAEESTDVDRADEGAKAVNGKFITRVLPSSDSCGLDGEALPTIELVDIEVSKDGREFDYVEGDTPIHCVLAEGGGYDCTLDSQGIGVVSEAEVHVAWSSKDRFEGTFSMTLDCEKPGPACAMLEKGFPNGLPCSIENKYVGTAAVAESFAPAKGKYELEISDPVMTTCKQPFPQAKKFTATLASKQAGKVSLVVDSSIPPMECELGEGGTMSCSQTQKVLSGTFATTLETAWTSTNSFEGGQAIVISCEDGGDECLKPAGLTLGELPCATVYSLKAKRAGASAQ
jgi:hypothetical protein